MTTTNSATSTTSSSSTSSTATNRTKLSANFDTFIKLLTTQLQYQDPMAPMDTNAFTQQLVQYSQVEQQLSTNDKLDDLITLSKGQGVNAAIGYLGKTISTESNNVALQDKVSQFSVAFDSTSTKTVTSLSISISDADGKFVRGFTIDKPSSGDVYVWDGKDANGNQLADGAYKVSVAATAADKTSVKSTVTSMGRVTGIDLDSDGNTVLKIGDVSVSPSKVKSVTETASASTSTGSTTTGTTTDTTKDTTKEETSSTAS